MDELNFGDVEANQHPDRRIAELESRYTHLQRTVDELNGVVIDQSRRIESLERRWERMLSQVTALTARAAETGTLEDERPPHY